MGPILLALIFALAIALAPSCGYAIVGNRVDHKLKRLRPESTIQLDIVALERTNKLSRRAKATASSPPIVWTLGLRRQQHHYVMSGKPGASIRVMQVGFLMSCADIHSSACL
jgi:hypothetical protein